PRDLPAPGWHDRGAGAAAAVPWWRRRHRKALSDVSRIRDAPRRGGRVRLMATVLKAVIGASQSRVQIPAPPPFAASLAGWLALIAPPIAAIIVTVAGLMTPGYDPITRTVSRLAEPGRPAAVEVDLAVYLVALALLMLAVSTRPRGLLGVAGCALVVVASVHLDSTSTAATAAHRLASGVAMLAQTAAPF